MILKKQMKLEKNFICNRKKMRRTLLSYKKFKSETQGVLIDS